MKPMTDKELIRWIIENLLNESQLDVVPPGEVESMRFISRRYMKQE